MIAILVHFIGHLMVDSTLPPGTTEAGAYFLAKWYAAFVVVDIMAFMLARNAVLRILLGASIAWSMALVLEQLCLQDVMQSRDWIVQILLDTPIAFVGLWCATRGREYVT